MFRYIYAMIAIKHVFSCINIRWVPREVLKISTFDLGFQYLPRYPANVNARKNMFDPYTDDAQTLPLDDISPSCLLGAFAEPMRDSEFKKRFIQ